MDTLPSGGADQKRASATCDAFNNFPLGHQPNIFSVSQALPSLLPAVQTLLLMVSAKIEITSIGMLTKSSRKYFAAS